jgi:sporulation protein YhbH
MAVVGNSGLPRDEGRRDALHHRERVRRKITEQLRERIGEEDIIAAGPEKRIRVPVKGTRRWRFILDRELEQGVGAGGGEPGDVIGPPGGQLPGAGEAGLEPGEELYEVWLDMEDVEEILFSELELPRLRPKQQAGAQATEVVFDDLARQGPRIDKKATLRENLARNARRGRTRLSGIEKADLRFLSYRERPEPRHKAVIFLAMDVSGSMDADRKRMARLFFYWCAQFLRRRYDQTEIVFIAHTTEAREVTEEEFFGRAESGGTRVSSAFEEIERIQRERFPSEDWNIYVLHVSDGDNFTADNPNTLHLIERLTRACALVGYLQVDPSGYSARWSGAAYKLSSFYAEHASGLDGFVFAEASDDRELWPALKKFFAKEGVEAAVR